MGFFASSSNAMTIFSKIIRKEIPAKIVYEDDQCMAFHDVHPQAPVHILLIPKKEIVSMADVKKEDKDLLGYLMYKASEIAQEQGLEKGYRLVINTKSEGGQTVDHLHIHILGKRRMKWPPG